MRIVNLPHPVRFPLQFVEPEEFRATVSKPHVQRRIIGADPPVLYGAQHLLVAAWDLASLY